MAKVHCKKCYKLKPDDGYYSCKECRIKANENSKKRRMRLIENGLCTRCGEICDRPGKHMCQKCLGEANQYRRDTLKFRNGLGFCGKCGKNPVFGDEKNCPECRAYYAAEQTMSRLGRRDEINRRENERKKERRKHLADQGICNLCGIVKADEGYKTCSACRRKKKRYSERRIANKGPEWTTWNGE